MNEHPVLLRNPDFLGGGEAPVFLRRTDQRFIDALLDELSDEIGRKKLLAKCGLPSMFEKQRGEGLKLYLPVHRCFNLVVMEAVCETPGFPRLDPAKVHSAGMVVRRKMPRKSVMQRYLVRGNQIVGWEDVPVGERRNPPDPDPRFRPKTRFGDPELDRMIHAMNQTVEASEAVATLYPVPPEICAAAGRSFYYGLVPVTDNEIDEIEEPPASTTPDDLRDMRQMLPMWLKSPPPSKHPVPPEIAGARVRAVLAGTDRVVQISRGGGWFEIKLPQPGGPMVPDANPDRVALKGWNLSDFLRMLWQVRYELEAFLNPFGDVMKVLNQSSLTMPDGTRRPMGDWMGEAARVMILGETGLEVPVPEKWPTLPESRVRELSKAAFTALDQTARRSTGSRGRFTAKSAEYELRTFLRVYCENGCPPKIVWAKPSALYRLAAWSDGPPEGVKIPQLELPDLTRAFLENVRPNIAIKVPAPLFNLLRNNSPESFAKGEAKNKTEGFDFVWICSFSIPIITLVAFIVLFIFLVLLNIVFWWLPFVKICIPLPGSLARRIGAQ